MLCPGCCREGLAVWRGGKSEGGRGGGESGVDKTFLVGCIVFQALVGLTVFFLRQLFGVSASECLGRCECDMTYCSRSPLLSPFFFRLFSSFFFLLLSITFCQKRFLSQLKAFGKLMAILRVVSRPKSLISLSSCCYVCGCVSLSHFPFFLSFLVSTKNLPPQKTSLLYPIFLAPWP